MWSLAYVAVGLCSGWHTLCESQAAVFLVGADEASVRVKPWVLPINYSVGTSARVSLAAPRRPSSVAGFDAAVGAAVGPPVDDGVDGVELPTGAVNREHKVDDGDSGV